MIRYVLLSALFFGLPCYSLLADGPANPLNLETAAVGKVVIPDELYVDGIIEATNQATVSAQTSGTIVDVRFDVNDFVRQGDVIAEFKSVEQQAALNKAQAGLKSALAQQRDTAAEHERISKVYEKGAVSKSQMDKLTALLRKVNADVESARAELARANEQVKYTEIRAPYSGIVTRRHIEVGEAASPGKPIMTGLSLDDLRVQAYVPQQQISAVMQHELARIIIETSSGTRSVSSDLVTVFPFADAASHALAVRVELPPNTPGLFPGMYVKVAFTVGEDARLVIPEQAIFRRSEITAVYVLQPDGFVTMRQIRSGREVLPGQVEVLAGLLEGEQIVLDPQMAYVKGRQEH